MATKKAAAKTRGSKKLSKKAGASQTLASRLKALGKGALSNDIIINGTPRPDAFKGTITVKPSAAGGVLNQLLKIPGAQYKPVQLFPKGQPPAIDQILIKVDAKVR
ncbi:MAG TPA: hypothetical protein VMS31_02070 [Pyrinomonadaceae bacterium]|nr:hypothetical protein [Pyrinomonadaceae bacterium]